MVVDGDLHTFDAPFLVFRLHTIYINVHAIQIECNENMYLLWKTRSPCYIHGHWYMHFSHICPIYIGSMHIILEVSWFHCTNAFRVGYWLFRLIACVGYGMRKGWSCAHLVGVVLVVDGDLHTFDAPFFVFRLHTIYINVDAIQIECNENTYLLRKTRSPCYIHGHWYMHLSHICPITIESMHIILEASWFHCTHAFRVGFWLFRLIACGGMARGKDGVVRTWWGRWWLSTGTCIHLMHHFLCSGCTQSILM